VKTSVTTTQDEGFAGRFKRAGLAMAAASIGLAAAAPALAQPDQPSPAAAIDQPQSSDLGATPYDPWRRVNRPIFGFSMQLDRGLIAPIAHGYRRITPSPIRNRVSAAVDNLGEPGTALNDVAQGHPKRAGVATARFVVNSTLGLLGLFDVATGMNLPPHDSDFGQTLGRYGIQPGPYVYVPIVGPSDLRDGVGRIVDTLTDPISLFTGGVTTTLGATRFTATTLDTRLNADSAFRALDDATDPYATTRSAYTQRRASVVDAATGKTEVLPDFDADPAAPSPPSPPAPP
jgi:phospholipid-binding lipoprotein MlaA